MKSEFSVLNVLESAADFLLVADGGGGGGGCCVRVEVGVLCFLEVLCCLLGLLLLLRLTEFQLLLEKHIILYIMLDHAQRGEHTLQHHKTVYIRD